MRTIPYDPSRTALHHPDVPATVLKPGNAPSDALLCSEAARLVYKRFENNPSVAREIQDAVGSLGFEEIDYFFEQGSKAFAAYNRSSATALIAFRGTTRGLDDILTDLKTWPRSWAEGGRVHAGFSEAFELHRAKLSSWLACHQGRWLLTGHSLGGALAALAASIFKPARLITFGTPRVGDDGFSLALEGIDALRYANCCDIVTRVPPEFLGYRHCGELHYIDHTGAIHINPDREFIRADGRQGRRAYHQAYALHPNTVKLRQLADHAPINYIYPIQAAESTPEQPG